MERNWYCILNQSTYVKSLRKSGPHGKILTNKTWIKIKLNIFNDNTIYSRNKVERQIFLKIRIKPCLLGCFFLLSLLFFFFFLFFFSATSRLCVKWLIKSTTPRSKTFSLRGLFLQLKRQLSILYDFFFRSLLKKWL